MNPYNKSTEWPLWLGWEDGFTSGLERANQIMLTKAYHEGRKEYIRNGLAPYGDQTQFFPYEVGTISNDSWWEGWNNTRYSHLGSGLTLGEFREQEEKE